MAALVVISAAGGGHTGRAVAVAEKLRGRLSLVFIIARGDEWSLSRLRRLGGVVEVSRFRSPN